MRIPWIWIAVFATFVAVTNGISVLEPGAINIYTEENPGVIGSNVTVLESEIILAELNFSGDTLTACRLSSIYRSNSTFMARIEELFPERRRIDGVEMSKWVKDCGLVEKAVLSKTLFEELKNAFQHEIVLGTLWCGPGNIAPNYTYLGPAMKTDICCRNHDFCPICIPPNQHDYGLKDGLEYSVLSCECDHELQQCLLDAALAGEKIALAVEKIYFGLYDGVCLQMSQAGEFIPMKIKQLFNK